MLNYYRAKRNQKKVQQGNEIVLSFKEFFVADFFFCFIFSDDLGPKSINVWKDLFAPTVPQIEFSNNYKIVQQLK